MSIRAPSAKEAAEEKREKAAAKREREAAKKEKVAAQKAKVAAKKEKAKAANAKAKAKATSSSSRSGAKLPDAAAAIKKELETLNAKQAALIRKLEKAVTTAGTKRKAPTKSPKKAPAKKAKTTEEAEDEDEDEEKKEPEDEEEEEDEEEANDGSVPSDSALEKAVKTMLEGADLESVSMKKIRAELEEKFGVSLAEKKAVIKGFVEIAIGGE